jgi:RND family efflux transporter MFP subunit
MRLVQVILRFVLGLAAVGACFGAWWIVYQDSRARVAIEDSAAPEDVLTVQVMPVRLATVEERSELVGSLMPHNQVEIRARVSGYITALPYDVGDEVAAGRDVVFLDDSEQQELVATAQSALSVAQAELAASTAEHALAEQTLKRQRDLRASGAGTEQQLEAAEGAVNIAAARIDLNQAKVTQAESALRSAKLGLQDLRMPAPIDGVVGRRFVDVGNLAQPATPLLLLVDLATVETIVHVVERDYGRVKLGQRADICVDACPDETFQGEVTRIAPVVDPETRTAAVHIAIPNPTGVLKPGMHARVAIVFQSRSGSRVAPIDAVVQTAEGASVFVVAGDPPVVERREVRTGMNDGEVVEILEGLSRNERVVTLGNRLVQHGQRVNPEAVEWPVSVAAAAGDEDPVLTPSQ